MLTGMMLGEVSPGGVGTGLYGILCFAVITVFIGGLMVGRTPEYLGEDPLRVDVVQRPVLLALAARRTNGIDDPSLGFHAAIVADRRRRHHIGR